MTATNQQILTMNSGSSSIKVGLFDAGTPVRQILSGSLERLGQLDSFFTMKGPDQEDTFTRHLHGATRSAALTAFTDWLEERCVRVPLAAAGHRLVQGGPNHYMPERATPALLADLQQLSQFDPDHLPDEIKLIQTIQEKFPDLVQIACFDTAFHHDLPRVAQMLAIPRRYEAQGVRRYGFHGLSYQFLMEELAREGPQVAEGRVILAHLGSGSSLAAVHRGKPVDTSMGFTPTSGVSMGTRSGDLDPGLVLYFARTEAMTAQQFSAMVNTESGLLGVSERSSDMRDLLEHAGHDFKSEEAITLFCYQVTKCIGAFAAIMGGVDTLVFAGGIGENAPEVRARICRKLAFLGIQLDAERNRSAKPVISKSESHVQIRVIATDEQRVIAQTVCQLLRLTEHQEN